MKLIKTQNGKQYRRVAQTFSNPEVPLVVSQRKRLFLGAAPKKSLVDTLLDAFDRPYHKELHHENKHDKCDKPKGTHKRDSHHSS